MVSLLNAVIDFNLLEQGYIISLGWLGKIVRAIIEGVGVIGVGIIVFTLILKCITLPFDIYQRIKMRKQTLIMREMQPELEKLQKQFANDKNMYNQKMMELYKKNGYSIFGACLPMLISFIILIVAFQAFRSFSSYANLNMYQQMSVAYNEAVSEYVVDGKDYRLPIEGTEDDELTLTWQDGWTATEDGVIYTMFSEGDVRYMQVFSEDEKLFIGYIYSFGTTEAPVTGIVKEYKIDIDRLYSDNIAYTGTAEEQEAGIDTAKKKIDALMEGGASLESACTNYVVKIGAERARDWYRAHDSGFLWIKNVWFPDVSYNHPIQDYSGFSSQFSKQKVTFADGTQRQIENVITETQYDYLTSELTEEKDQANGYFILIILSIGLMLLSQFITMRSQKETNKYQTVDGQGARTQKIMLVMLPLIYAFFAFMYSAAFSIYMVVSSACMIIVTLLSNLIIGRVYRKKEERLAKEQYTRTLPWMQQDDKKGGKKKK